MPDELTELQALRLQVRQLKIELARARSQRQKAYRDRATIHSALCQHRKNSEDGDKKATFQPQPKSPNEINKSDPFL